MKKRLKKYSRPILGVVTAGLIFAFVTLTGHMSLSSNDLGDEDKRQKVEDMYNGYKREFPEVKDVSAQKAMALLTDGEAVFIDIRERCCAGKLTVYGRYQRRGGLDINPFRSNYEDAAENLRLWRQ